LNNNEEETMKTLIGLFLAALAAFGAPNEVRAQSNTIKIGIIAPFSGVNAHFGRVMRQALQTYVAQHGDTIDGKKLEFIYRDSGGVNPSLVRSHAQELILKDKVSYIGGINFSPNALAIAPIVQQAKIPTVLFNAATSSVTQKSDFFVRPSNTLWQVYVPLAQYAREEGISKVVTAVHDFNAGHDSEEAFSRTFEKLGGKVLEKFRIPMTTTDFAPFIQRIKNSGAEAVVVFLIAGPPSLAFIKAYKENGLPEAGIKYMGMGETDETNLQEMGDAALGIITTFHYSMAHESELNRQFVKKYQELFPGEATNFVAIGAYDGTHVLYQMIKAAGAEGGQKAIDAVKGMKWESPRGPVMIDPATRHVTQNVYIRRVERGPDGKLINKEFKTYEAQPDHGYNLGQ
jgi:branched-chain amino acid transport system substrate-binding protein